MKLNDEQRKIVTENHNLIYSFCIKRGLSIDEWYDFLAIVLCKAVINHNPEKSKLSTFVYACMNNAVNSELLKINKKANIPICEIDNIFLENYDDVGINDVINKISKTQKRIIKMKMLGYTQKEISNTLNISQAQVSRLIWDIKRRLNYLKKR